MTEKSFIKTNKLLSTVTIALVAWVAFLIVATLIGPQKVQFYDYLAKKDVSSEYFLDFPITRYIFEPLVAMVDILTIREYYWPLAIVLGYIVLRIAYIVLKKNEKLKSEKINLLLHIFRDFLEFAVKALLIALACVAAYFLIGWLVFGPFIKYGMFRIIEIVVNVVVLSLLLKIAFIAVKLFHPHLKFNYISKIVKNAKKNRTGVQKFSTGFKKELIYLLGFLTLILSSTLILMQTNIPMQSIETDLDENEILLDMHAHTFYSDGWISPEQRIQWYIAQGITVAAITDHNTIQGALIAKKFVEDNDLDFTVIVGQEYTPDESPIHLNIYGLRETIVPIEFKGKVDAQALDVEDMIKYVKGKGGYVVVNHYFKDSNEKKDKPYTLEELRDFGVDGFEIINGGDKMSEEIREFCLDNDLACFSCNDIHTNWALNSFMKVKLNDSDDLSLDNLFTTLKKNRQEAVIIKQNPRTVQFQDFFEGMVEPENFLNYLLNLNEFQCLSWIVWSIGAYAVFAGVRTKLKNYDLSRLKKKML